MPNVIRTCAAALALAAGAMPAAAQQGDADQFRFAYQAARNQLGLLEYCRTSGHIDGSAMAVQLAMLGKIPAPADTKAGDEAEAKGRKGVIAAMGVEKSLEEAGAPQGVKPDQLCKQLSDAMKQAGEAMKKDGAN